MLDEQIWNTTEMTLTAKNWMYSKKHLYQDTTWISLGLNLDHCSERIVIYHISHRTAPQLLSVVYAAFIHLHQSQGTVFHLFSWQLSHISNANVYHVKQLPHLSTSPSTMKAFGISSTMNVQILFRVHCTIYCDNEKSSLVGKKLLISVSVNADQGVLCKFKRWNQQNVRTLTALHLFLTD